MKTQSPSRIYHQYKKIYSLEEEHTKNDNFIIPFISINIFFSSNFIFIDIYYY